MTAEEATYSLAAVFGLGMIVAFCILHRSQVLPSLWASKRCGAMMSSGWRECRDIEMMDVQPWVTLLQRRCLLNHEVPSVAGILLGLPWTSACLLRRMTMVKDTDRDPRLHPHQCVVTTTISQI